MQAMVLNKPQMPLEWTELPDKEPGPGEIRVKIAACGVCRTDLHVVDGELPHPKSPIIPGHEVVGRIDALGLGVEGLSWSHRSISQNETALPLVFQSVFKKKRH